MIGIFVWSATISYYLYLWKSRKVHEIDRLTLTICLLLLSVSYVITLWSNYGEPACNYNH